MFMVDVPGAKAETLELEVEGRRLHLRAPVSEGRGWRRAFEVGELVDVDAIEAKVEQGVLSLTLPKREAPAPRRITVQA